MLFVRLYQAAVHSAFPESAVKKQAISSPLRLHFPLINVNGMQAVSGFKSIQNYIYTALCFLFMA